MNLKTTTKHRQKLWSLSGRLLNKKLKKKEIVIVLLLSWLRGKKIKHLRWCFILMLRMGVTFDKPYLLRIIIL